MSNLKALPDCLVNYLRSPVLERSEAQVSAFMRRMRHVAEVTETLRQWTIAHERTSFEVLDDIDADVNAILSVGVGSDNVDSLFLMHSSWTADLSAAAMSESLRKETVGFICAGFDKLLLSEQDVRAWLEDWVSAMTATLEDFEASGTADEAVGRVVGSNLLLCKLQMFIAMTRLNPLLERGT